MAVAVKGTSVVASARRGAWLLGCVSLAAAAACSPADEPHGSGGNVAGSAGVAAASGGRLSQGGTVGASAGTVTSGGAAGSVASGGSGGSIGLGGGTPGTGGALGGGWAGSAGASAGAGGATAGSGGMAGSGGASGFYPCPATGDCKVLPLGDSITFGTPTNNGGYRVELFARAMADGKHMTFVGSRSNGPATVAGKPFPKNNEGYPGWTISQINDIANGMEALKDSPHIVLLHIGTNDMSAMSTGAPDRLGKLIDDIVMVLPDSLLVVSSIIPLPFASDAVATYNAAVPGVVKQRADAGKHVIFVDQFENFLTSELADGVHPDDAKGYPRMADVWYAGIKSYLH